MKAQQILTTSTTALLLCTFVATPALAQETPATKPEAQSTPASQETEVVVVTATKSQQNIRNVPISISALTAGQVDRLGGSKFNEFLSGVSGVSIQDLGAERTNVIIRGVSTTPDGGSTVASYFDELPYGGANNSLQIKAIDIERIEVLRGPQAILYGADSLSGTLRLIPVRPNLSNTASGADLTLSSVEESNELSYDASVFLNLPIIADKVAVRAAGFYEKEAGFVNNIRLGTLIGDFESYGGRFSVAVKPSDTINVLGQYVYQNNKTDGNGNYRPILSQSNAGRGRFQIDREVEYLNRRVHLAGLTINAMIGEGTLTSVTSYRDNAFDSQRDRSFNSVAAGLPFSPILEVAKSGSTTFSQEVRLTSSTDQDLFWVIGAFYQRGRTALAVSNFFGDNSIAPKGSIFDQTINTLARSQDISVFGEVTYKVTPEFDVAIGARYTWFDLKNRAMVAIPGVTGDLTFDANSKPESLNPQITLKFKPNNNHTYFARAAKGFRTPNVQFPTGTTCTAPALESDSVYNYELGTKLRLADGAASLNASIYYIDWRGIPIAVTPSGCLPTDFLLVNAGNGRSYGLEADFTAKVSDSIRINISATLSKAQIGNVPPTFTGAVSKEELPGNANLRVSGGINYFKPINASLNAFVDLTAIYVGPSKVFQSGDFTGQFAPVTGFFPGTIINGVDPANLRDPGAGDYVLVNLSLGVDHENWSASLYVDNVSNSRASSAFFLPADQTIPGEAPFSPVQPRKIGMRFSAKF
jgi:iron complex outermembrane recepter protein